ncbi:hypothetical protein [Anaeromicropila herbilytica]|uniref:RanBP2-type domain-containing protein n=1 Tax=Anaeromicropila herbilytica TaxID=2785025 RepID=A0A7R7IE85_9FIRM|nr:hypothetical protein [Anaeromicropila herbilytica]BCN30833.1 hypothetical protein bsdtb5_21280 [Anaeromicropila herbilytica]
MEDKIIEGYWDCDYCEKKAIKGHLRECPSCGKARGENTEFYLLDRTYLDDEAAEKVSMNPDWLCSYCEQLNSDFDNKCKSCGAPKQESKENYFEMRAREDENDIDQNRSYQQFETSNSRTNQTTPPKPGKFKSFCIVFAILLLICWPIFSYDQSTGPKTVKVTGFEWNKTLEIEQYQTVDDNDWSLPEKARLIDTKREIYSYDQKFDHYETIKKKVPYQEVAGYHYVTSTTNLGNGHFKETRRKVTDYKTVYKTESYKEAVYIDVPVYKKKYYYVINKWIPIRNIESSGKNQKDYIGKYTLAKATKKSGIGKEREGMLEEHYFIKTIDKKDNYIKYEVSVDDWKTIKLNESIKIKDNGDGYATVVKEDKPKKEDKFKKEEKPKKENKSNKEDKPKKEDKSKK